MKYIRKETQKPGNLTRNIITNMYLHVYLFCHVLIIFRDSLTHDLHVEAVLGHT